MNASESDSLDDFERSFAAAWETSKWVNVGVLVAFSGGPDSTALVRCLSSLQPDRSNLAVAHFNHRLRGKASDADQEFVQHTAGQLGLDCHVQAAAPGSMAAQRSGQGLEAVARSQRYAFLVKTAEQMGARYLVTGHTTDDQIETILHRILRGTGLAGLTGIPSFRRASEAVTIARPMLSIQRADVLDYLRRLDQDYREDAANEQSCFTRNRIRLDLLPLLKRDFNPEVGEALLRLSRIAGEAQSALRHSANRLVDQCVIVDDATGLRIDTSCISNVPLHLRRECFVVIWQRKGWPLQAMHFDQWQQLAQLAGPTAVNQSLNLPGEVRVTRFETQLNCSRTR